MKQLNTTFLFGKKRKVQIFFLIVYLLFFFNKNATAQNASYGSNFIPINGVNSSAFGYRALFSNSGSGNTATGYNSLYKNTSGNYNTANGYRALYSNTTGVNNLAVGSWALYSNTTGSNNTASGAEALNKNTSGHNNTAVGGDALYSNTIGESNTAIGLAALYQSTTGDLNTAIGGGALYGNNTGYYNTGVGSYALNLNVTGTYNTSLGSYAGGSASLTNSMALGYNAWVSASNKIVIGNSSIISIGGYQSWTKLSDARFKKAIKEDVHGLDFIMQLKPVTYNMDVRKLNTFLGIDERKDRLMKESRLPAEEQEKLNRIDEQAIAEKEAIRYTGFLAQQVQKSAEAVGYNFSGVIKPANEKDHYSVSYEEFVVPLVKAVQEQQEIITEQQKVNEQLQQRVDKLEKLVGQLINTSSKTYTDVELSNAIKFNQNTPNPFIGETNITYAIPYTSGKAQLVIYNALGELVKTLNVPAGDGILKISARDLNSGVYNCSLTIDGRTIKTISMVKQ